MSDPPTRSDVRSVVPQALGRLRVALNHTYTDASRELGLTPQQAELLCATTRPRPIGDLARLLHCDRSNISRLVNRASARGLLERHGEQADGRVSMIALTPDGQRLAAQFIARLESLTEPLLATWSKRRQLDTAETLGSLAGTLESAIPDEPGNVSRRVLRDPCHRAGLEKRRVAETVATKGVLHR